MKKILILGGSHRDIPLIKAAQELGYFVVTLGDRDYYLGHKYSNQAIKINFNDLSKVKQIIKNEKIDYIIPGSGEESYLNTVKLSHELNIGNFDSMETANLVHNKWRFKEFCLTNDISTPKGIYVNTNKLIDNLKLNFPIVVKPTNLSGGRGVKVVQNTKELEKAIKLSNNISDELFLEEYIEGKLIAYSVFLKDQRIIYAFSGADDIYLNPYLITTAYPITLDKDVEQKLSSDINKIAEELNLVNGMFHLQVIIKNNIPYIIDVTRRIPGDLYPDLIEYCDKVKYSQAVVKAYIGYDITNEFKQNKRKEFIIRHVVMPDKNGIYNGLDIDNSIKDKIIKRFDLIENGYKIDDYLHTQITILFIQLDATNLKIISNINKAINILYYKLTNQDF